MTAKTLFRAIVFCGTLLGCATQPLAANGTTLRCMGQNCDVQVTVSCSAGVCSASVDNETVQIPRGNSPIITWQVMSPGYTFPSNGIVIANGGAEFDCRVEANGRRFTCHDKHTRSDNYKYTVNLSGAPAVPPLDPFIENQ